MYLLAGRASDMRPETPPGCHSTATMRVRTGSRSFTCTRHAGRSCPWRDHRRPTMTQVWLFIPPLVHLVAKSVASILAIGTADLASLSFMPCLVLCRGIIGVENTTTTPLSNPHHHKPQAREAEGRMMHPATSLRLFRILKRCPPLQRFFTKRL